MYYKNINLKKVFYYTGVIVIACVIASSVIASWTTENQKPTEGDTTSVSVSDKVYVLKSENDRIVAYIKGVDRPFIETTRTASSLPYDIQQKLVAGIEFDSEEKLRAAINEYCS
ncbi:MAG: hypothetical protein E7563_06885 [Ruminococcaceae bacterium]|nr:hypothetical protein [Oscillospiraceae bacterium]